MGNKKHEAWVLKNSLAVNVSFGISDTENQFIGHASDLDNAAGMLLQAGWASATGGAYEWEPYENGWSTYVVPAGY